ncbi:unnamed protein product, partial [Closterium sp. NIES-53]
CSTVGFESLDREQTGRGRRGRNMQARRSSRGGEAADEVTWRGEEEQRTMHAEEEKKQRKIHAEERKQRTMHSGGDREQRTIRANEARALRRRRGSRGGQEVATAAYVRRTQRNQPSGSRDKGAEMRDKIIYALNTAREWQQQQCQQGTTSKGESTEPYSLKEEQRGMAMAAWDSLQARQWHRLLMV